LPVAERPVAFEYLEIGHKVGTLADAGQNEPTEHGV
jgi:hypothetical protein